MKRLKFFWMFLFALSAVISQAKAIDPYIYININFRVIRDFDNSILPQVTEENFTRIVNRMNELETPFFRGYRFVRNQTEHFHKKICVINFAFTTVDAQLTPFFHRPNIFTPIDNRAILTHTFIGQKITFRAWHHIMRIVIKAKNFFLKKKRTACAKNLPRSPMLWLPPLTPLKNGAVR